MNAPRRVPPDAPARRGWCPSLNRPMPTGDGLLARVHPPLGRLTLVQARAVAEAARRFGNGHIDVTARANLQVRGVTEGTMAPLAARLTAEGLGDIRADGGPQRLTLTAPTAGADTLALAAAVEATGQAIPSLPAKTLVAVEDESPFGLADIEADARLRILGPDRVAWALARPDGPIWFGPVPAEKALDRVVAALENLARSGARRMRDVADRAIAETPTPPLPLLPAAAPGLHALGPDGFALALDAAFGRCTADGLDRLAARADAIGVPVLLVSPSRGFVLVGRDAAALREVQADLTGPGFIGEVDDPRSAVAACPGAPACASGTTPTLADADRLAEALRPFTRGGLLAHLSGCAKGCAHPAEAPLTLVGRDGLYDVVLHGRPDALPASRLTFEAALDRVRSADSARSLAQAFQDPDTMSSPA